MDTNEQIKDAVRQKYDAIAQQATSNLTGTNTCCGSVSNTNVAIVMAEDYRELNGYVADADLGLGCGLPTQFACIQPGDTVVDLGSGAGNDCFIARQETGETGRVIGLDMTPTMIDCARQNAKALGYTNVDFVYGDIEDIPLPDKLADVVVSNCVMNLVPNKQKAFSETYRLLKPEGHFSISDIVLQGDLPVALQRDAALYVGCVAGAIQKDVYLHLVEASGFTNIQVQRERKIDLPDSILQNHLSVDELADYHWTGGLNPSWGIYSVTVFAQKPKPETTAL